MILRLSGKDRRGGELRRAEDRRRRRLRPTLLALEDRKLLSTWTVSNTGDSGVGSGLSGDLRYCITGANSAGGDQAVVFDSSLDAQTITLTHGQLVLNDTTGTETITGPSGGVTISGNNASRVFQVDKGATAAFSGLTISAGHASGGGGLFNLGTATLTDCVIRGNYGGHFSLAPGGGVANGNHFSPHASLSMTGCTISGNTAGGGGGLYNATTATLTDCTIENNAATNGSVPTGYGGGVQTGGWNNSDGATSLNGCTISGNSARRGGGVSNHGTTALAGCTVSGNSATLLGGGLLGTATTFDGSKAGTLTLTGCTVSGNTAMSGGGVYTTGAADRFFPINSPPTVGAKDAETVLNNCTVSGNTASANGGGLGAGEVGVTTATGTTVSGNAAVNGGGLFTGGGTFYGLTLDGTTDLTNDTVSDNSASGLGGGLDNGSLGNTTATGINVQNNTAVSGGGIANQDTLDVASSNIINNTASSAGGGISTTAGTATITDSVINTNQVLNPSGTALGGGIDCENSTLALTDCTVNANRADGTNAYGGGIYALGSTVSLQGGTVNGNRANGTATGEGGGIYAFDTALSLVATKVKGNKATTGYNDIFEGA